MENPARIYSLSNIAIMTGKSHHTIRDLFERLQIAPDLENDRGKYYDTARVLPVIYQTPNDVKTQREIEELEYTRAKKEKTEVETYLLKKDLIPAEEVLKTWGKVVNALKTKLLTLPAKSALLVKTAETPEEVESILKDWTYLD